MSREAAPPTLDAIAVHGDAIVREARHGDAIAALGDSPVQALLETVHALQAVLLSANPKALRARVGWLGRLLGRDLVLDAEGKVLRERLRQLLHDADAKLAAFARFDAGIAAQQQRLSASIDALGSAIEALAGEAAGAHADAAERRRLHLLSLQQAWRITSTQLGLARDNHRQLAQRIAPMLPLVQALLEQDHGLQAARGDADALRSVHHALDAANTALAGYSPTHPATPEHAP